MSFFRGDASEVYELAADLRETGVRAVAPLRAAMSVVGKNYANAWRANAAQTSGKHGRHYPASIDSELVLDLSGVSVDVGPNRAKRQGGMGQGFELGSRNQPPHLDGLRAAPAAGAAAEKAISAAIESVL